MRKRGERLEPSRGWSERVRTEIEREEQARREVEDGAVYIPLGGIWKALRAWMRKKR